MFDSENKTGKKSKPETITEEKGFVCTYSVDGMHCKACELLIESKLKNVANIEKVDAKLGSKVVVITMKDKSKEQETLKEINQIIKDDGYKINVDTPIDMPKILSELRLSFLIALIVFFLFSSIQSLEIFSQFKLGDTQNLPTIFLIGVIASMSSCLAVVGSMVLTLSAGYSKSRNWMPMLAFHISRLIGFFVLGGVVGFLGSRIAITPFFSLIINIILFLVMFILSFSLLDLSPALNKFQLTTPKVFVDKIFNLKDSSGFIAPFLFGVLSFFLPCGFTQSMQFYALSSGNFLQGGAIMLTFALGTLPVLALISFGSYKLGGIMKSGLFYKTAAFLILFFAISNLYGALVAAGILLPVIL